MRKVAIVLCRDFEISDQYGDGDSYSRRIAESITDWTEVTDEEFDVLYKAQNYDYHKHFVLIERPVDEKQYIDKTVKAYLKWAQAEAEKREQEKRQREEAALTRKMKKEAKTLADKQKMLAKLKQELGEG